MRKSKTKKKVRAEGGQDYDLNQLVSFIQHFLPGLNAGKYKLNLSQQVLDEQGDPVSGPAYEKDYKFGITADRFVLSDPALISSVFPAVNGSGEFSNVLPHVVFDQPTFPWVRYPTTSPPYDAPPPGQDVPKDVDVPTWLWVMLLDEDDLANYPDLSLSPSDSLIGDLFPPDIVSESNLGENYSYFYAAPDTSVLDPGETILDQIQTIDIPMELFWKLAPTVDDLKQMAHGREVSLINMPLDLRSEPGEPTGTFSITFGNRFPQEEKKTFAFLVSLEQLQPFLPNQEGGGAPTDQNWDANKSIRLAVLYNWSFYSTGQSAGFVYQLESLNGRTPDGPPASNTNLRLEYGGSNPTLTGALNMGYVPLNEKLRTAEKTVSWYRGPLLPYQINKPAVDIPIASPDAAMKFDPTTGMLDVSYASAWSIGRMVALQDTAFSVSLYNYKNDLAAQVQEHVEDTHLESTFGAALDRSVKGERKQMLKTDSFGSRNLLLRTLLALHPNKKK